MIRYILTDIEGTTTAIDFVHQTLFPYAAAHLPGFIRAHHSDPGVAAALDLVRATMHEEGIPAPDLEAVIAQALEWIRVDRKHTGLKDLQGFVWADGYATGQFQGHVYPDVRPAFERWKEAGIKMGVYSSGAVAAQQQLFGFSEAGDLTPFFSDYFDTRIGHKKEVSSYERILEALGLRGEEVLFLSDVEGELDAAKAAGMAAVQLLRAGTVASGRHAGVGDFSQLSV
jgi:enolase-phosphatase E1